MVPSVESIFSRLESLNAIPPKMKKPSTDAALFCFTAERGGAISCRRHFYVNRAGWVRNGYVDNSIVWDDALLYAGREPSPWDAWVLVCG